jgi:hypothetical protein
MVSVGGNLYSVPDTARKRVLDVQNHPSEVRIFEDGALIAAHPVLEARTSAASIPLTARRRRPLRLMRRRREASASGRSASTTRSPVAWPSEGAAR